MLRVLTYLIAALLLPATAAPSASLQVTWNPPEPAPGSLIRVTVAASGADELQGAAVLSGSVAGEELHFHREGEQFTALAGIPVDAADSLRISVFLTRNGEKVDSVAAEVPLPAIPVDTSRPREKLKVDSRFSRPDEAARARLARESAMAMAVSRGAHDTPRLWSLPFVRPRKSRITSQFGSGRVFNGELKSRHLGLDLAGAKGDPVLAANRGVVRLIGHFSLAGNCIYIDHGEGLVTAYFHLSHVAVAEGDTVSRGQRIGSVGATGRVTGPHLHWVARYGTITVDPLSLVAATNAKK